MFDYYEHVFATDDEKDYRGYIDAYITQQHQAGKSHRSPEGREGRCNAVPALADLSDV